MEKKLVENDIALIKLETDLEPTFQRSRNIQPICLAQNGTKLTKRCVATGWGNTDPRKHKK